jgi:hypothetical protein
MTMRNHYQDLTREELEQRLKLAEDVCVMIGWTAVDDRSPRGKAAHELWKRWASHVGSDFTGPAKHRDLDELEASFS